MSDLNRNEILSWFKGKARENAAAALALLVESEREGCWVPKAARSVRAALSKHNLAQRDARLARYFYDHADYEWVGEYPDSRDVGVKSDWNSIYAAMQYSSFRPQDLRGAIDHLKARDLSVGEREVVAAAERFLAAFAPVRDLLKLLDSRRPKRRIVMGTLSPTVAETLRQLDLNPATIREPEYEKEWVWVVNGRGENVQVEVWVAKWPDNCRHRRSRFISSARHHLCQACGHAIKDPYNWVVFLIDDRAGVPHSFCVGRDCARKLFGCSVEGDAKIENLADALVA